MPASRNTWIALCIGIMSAAAVPPSSAQTYPAKPVRIIAGATGNFGDVVSRRLAQLLSERWGRSVVVENRGGAGLRIGTTMASKAAPDGYTLLMADRTALAVAPSLHQHLPYDPIQDFAAVTLVASVPSLLIAHASVPAANLREFIDYARPQPGGIHFAAAGPGTVNHIASELFRHMTGVNLVIVQYKGGGASSAAIAGGEVKAGFSNLVTGLPHVNAGRVKAYAVASTKRFPGAPDIPTAAEAGLPGFESGQWIGIVVPARTPHNIVAKLNRDFVELLETPAVRDALLALGAEPRPGRPEEFAAFIRTETARLKEIIDRAGIRAD